MTANAIQLLDNNVCTPRSRFTVGVTALWERHLLKVELIQGRRLEFKFGYSTFPFPSIISACFLFSLLSRSFLFTKVLNLLVQMTDRWLNG